MQERFCAKKKDLYFTFVDLDYEFDRRWKMGDETGWCRGMDHVGQCMKMLFIMVLETLTREYRSDILWELLHADDFVPMAVEKMEMPFDTWTHGMERKGLHVISRKSKMMISQYGHVPQNKPRKFHCSVSQKGLGILCPMCKC